MPLAFVGSAFCTLPFAFCLPLKPRHSWQDFLCARKSPPGGGVRKTPTPFPLARAPARKVTETKSRPINDWGWLPCQACSFPSRTPRIRPPEPEAPQVSVSRLFFGNRGRARSFRIETLHLSPASQVLPAAQPPPRANQIQRPTFRTLQCRKTEVVPAHRNPQKPSHRRLAARPFQRGL